jgi:hypothetical protein
MRFWGSLRGRMRFEKKERNGNACFSFRYWKLHSYVLNFRLQQCAGSHQSIKECSKEDTDLLIILQWDESPLYIHSSSCYL